MMNASAMLCLALVCALTIIVRCECRYILPDVPEVMNPPVPYIVAGNETNVENETLVESNPELTPHLFEGDMALTDEYYHQWRLGLNWKVYPNKMWLNGIVPYVISPVYGPSEYVTIYKAIRMISYMTCVRFVPWDGNAKDYLLIWPIQQPSGCWSFVGRNGGAQILSLQPPDDHGPNCLGTEGRAIHELLHALGVFHEHSRWDRDKFINVHENNILPNYKSNFYKQSLQNATYSFEYDYNSIMHYGKYYFSKGKGRPTITPKKSDVTIGQRQGMSKGDCLKLNDLYNCFDNSLLRRKYYFICQFLGL